MPMSGLLHLAEGVFHNWPQLNKPKALFRLQRVMDILFKIQSRPFRSCLGARVDNGVDALRLATAIDPKSVDVRQHQCFPRLDHLESSISIQGLQETVRNSIRFLERNVLDAHFCQQPQLERALDADGQMFLGMGATLAGYVR